MTTLPPSPGLRRFSGFLLLIFALLPLSLQAQNPAPALTEKAKIEALITGVENLKDAKLIRNGSDYDAKTAAKFLRGKWNKNGKEIKTAGDFIDKAATKSATSGKPYLIRHKDGKETQCADHLRAELEKLNTPKGR